MTYDDKQLIEVLRLSLSLGRDLFLRFASEAAKGNNAEADAYFEAAVGVFSSCIDSIETRKPPVLQKSVSRTLGHILAEQPNLGVMQ